MRCRSDIERDIESGYRDDDGFMQYRKADDEGLQALTIEVLLDIRELLRV